jgi:hypothetical protein
MRSNHGEWFINEVMESWTVFFDEETTRSDGDGES